MALLLLFGFLTLEHMLFAIAEHFTKAHKLAQRPLLYHIPQFLPRHSVDALIDAAKPHLIRSGTLAEDPQVQSATDALLHTQKAWHDNHAHKALMFQQADLDQNGELCDSEVRRFLSQRFNMANHNHKKLLSTVQRNTSSLKLGLKQFLELDWLSYNRQIRNHWPHLTNRNSEQTWIAARQHPVAFEVLNRAAELFGIPMNVLLGGEPLQVVRYGRRGHYACHTDCTEGDLTRRATLLVFLNDDFKGGELTFPYVEKNINDTEWEDLKLKCLPVKQCASSVKKALVVKPKVGDALFWYNVEEVHNRVGYWSLVRQSMHAGCPVRKGTKWIANLWVPTSGTSV